MSDQNITELPVKTSSGITSSDYMLGIDSAEGYQMLIRDLGDYIIRNVQVNTIAGSNQTLKSALDALNSKTTVIFATDTDLNNYTSSGIWSFDKLSSAMSNAPDTGQYFSGTLFVEYYAGNKIMQVFISDSAKVFIRYRWNSSTTWGVWVAQPTRAEMDTVIKRGDYKSILDIASDAHDTQPGSYWVSRAASIPDGHQYGFLTHEVSGADTQERLLTFYPHNSPRVFYKATSNNAGSTWTAWYKYTGVQVS